MVIYLAAQASNGIVDVPTIRYRHTTHHIPCHQRHIEYRYYTVHTGIWSHFFLPFFFLVFACVRRLVFSVDDTASSEGTSASVDQHHKWRTFNRLLPLMSCRWRTMWIRNSFYFVVLVARCLSERVLLLLRGDRASEKPNHHRYILWVRHTYTHTSPHFAAHIYASMSNGRAREWVREREKRTKLAAAAEDGDFRYSSLWRSRSMVEHKTTIKIMQINLRTLHTLRFHVYLH